MTATQPRSRRRVSSVSTAWWRTNPLSCQPAARTNTSAITALAVLAATASVTPSTGPNSNPAASVNAVRGNGNTVTTMWAARKASGNQGPIDDDQSLNSTAVGNRTSSATATRATATAAVRTNR